jgi:hypothetical protein
MVNKSLLHRVLVGVALCCGASQLSMAQRPTLEPPLTPVPPRVQPPAPVGQVLSKDTDAAKATAPPATVTRVAVSRPQPLFLLNSEVIIASDGIQPAQIKTVMVYKGQDAPAQWRELVTYGIINITSKQKIKVKSSTLAAVGKKMGVSGPVRYTINTMPVANADLRIALDALGEIKITRAPESVVTTVAIGVRAPKPSTPRQDPPGTIYIRGLAAY